MLLLYRFGFTFGPSFPFVVRGRLGFSLSPFGFPAGFADLRLGFGRVAFGFCFAISICIFSYPRTVALRFCFSFSFSFFCFCQQFLSRLFYFFIFFCFFCFSSCTVLYSLLQFATTNTRRHDSTILFCTSLHFLLFPYANYNSDTGWASNKPPQ